MNASVLDVLLEAQPPAAKNALAGTGLGPAPDPLLFLQTLAGAKGSGSFAGAEAGPAELPSRLLAALEREPSPRHALPEPEALRLPPDAKGLHPALQAEALQPVANTEALHPALNQIVASLVGAQDRAALLAKETRAVFAPDGGPATPEPTDGRLLPPRPALPIDVLRGLAGTVAGAAPGAVAAARAPSDGAAALAQPVQGNDETPRDPAATLRGLAGVDPAALAGARPAPAEPGAALLARPQQATAPPPVSASQPPSQTLSQTPTDDRGLPVAPADPTPSLAATPEASARLANAAARLAPPPIAPNDRAPAGRETRRAVSAARNDSEPSDERGLRALQAAAAPARGPIASPGSTAFAAGEDFTASLANDPRGSSASAELRAAPLEGIDASVRSVAEPGADSASRAPVPASRVPEALAAHVERLSQGEGGTARIRLHPRSLGELHLQVRVRGQSVDVTVVAREAAAQALVAGGREQLADALSGRDLRMENFDVHGQDRDANEREAQRDAHAQTRGGVRDERHDHGGRERDPHGGSAAADPAATRAGTNHEIDAANAGDRVHWVI